MGRIILNYGASSFSGWGVEALNTLLYWPDEALTAAPDNGVSLIRTDPRSKLLEQRLLTCEAFRASLQSRFPQGGTAANPLFMPLGLTLEPSLAVNSIPLRGTPTIAFPYIEFPDQSVQFKDRLSTYDHIVVASHWNYQILKEWGFDPIFIPQAIDEVLFNPQARRPKTSSKFTIFSGGKAEYRKGQDIVLQAVSQVAQKHDDILLLAAWSSPWPNLSRSFKDCSIGEPPGASLGQPNFSAWSQRAGLKAHQFQSIPPTPNCRMIDILSEVDLAIFPNRSEGGTNQVAMECIACGIPTIISPGHGHNTLYMFSKDITIAISADDFVDAMEEAYVYSLPRPSLGEAFSWSNRISCLQGLLP